MYLYILTPKQYYLNFLITKVYNYLYFNIHEFVFHLLYQTITGHYFSFSIQNDNKLGHISYSYGCDEPIPFT